jgi:hypothetical protein
MCYTERASIDHFLRSGNKPRNTGLDSWMMAASLIIHILIPTKQEIAGFYPVLKELIIRIVYTL